MPPSDRRRPGSTLLVYICHQLSDHFLQNCARNVPDGIFVRDGILSVANYNSTRVGVVVVVVVVNTFLQWDNLRTL